MQISGKFGGRLVLFGALATSGAWAAALLPNPPHVMISTPWIRTPMDGYRSTVAALSVRSNAELMLLGASSPLAKSVQFQLTRRSGAVVRPERVAQISLKKDELLTFRLGVDQYQLLVLGLRRQVKEGDAVPLRLIFGDSKGRYLFDRTTSAVVSSPPGYTPHAAHDEH